MRNGGPTTHVRLCFQSANEVFYHLIDAALRWCNLIRYETQIMQAVWSRPETLAALFPQWPGLSATTEKIYDAAHNGDLPYGCLGISVPKGTYVDPYQLTSVRPSLSPSV